MKDTFSCVYLCVWNPENVSIVMPRPVSQMFSHICSYGRLGILHSSAVSLSVCLSHIFDTAHKNGKGSPYLITEHRVPELIPVLGSQPAGDVINLAVGCRYFPPGLQIQRAATNFAAW